MGYTPFVGVWGNSSTLAYAGEPLLVMCIPSPLDVCQESRDFPISLGLVGLSWCQIFLCRIPRKNGQPNTLLLPRCSSASVSREWLRGSLYPEQPSTPTMMR